MTNRTLALVTGASSGIGLELARQFATSDFDVVVVAEDAELTTAAADLRATGATIHEVRADLRSSAEVERLWAEVTALGRPLQAAALNAGVGRGAPSSTSTWLTTSRSSTSTSARPCTWPSWCCTTWPPATRGGC